MLHQTLISSPSRSSTFSSTISNPFLFLSFPPPPSLPSLSSQLEKQQESGETNMEPFKTVFLNQQNGVLSEEAVFVGERGNNTLFGGDAFSVEELLDLGEFTETQDVVITQERKELEKSVEKGGEIDEETENSNSSSGVTFDLPPPPAVIELPAHDAEELEWVSLIMDESLSELPATCTALPPPVPSKQRENKAKPTLCALSTESLLPAAKARRSKRSRATIWSLSGSENSGSDNSTTSSCSSSFLFYDSPFLSSSETPTFLLDDSPEPAMKKLKPKKRGRKPKAKNHHNQYSYPSSGSTTGERRCSHCGVNKTPQWRAGPEGAKTLCNACGVRYKSGRLLPEYRPACSPTFVSDLHSNSHRKVIEMRKKKETVVPVVASF